MLGRADSGEAGAQLGGYRVPAQSELQALGHGALASGQHSSPVGEWVAGGRVDGVVALVAEIRLHEPSVTADMPDAKPAYAKRRRARRASRPKAAKRAAR